MGGFLLCREKKANKPFFLGDINLNIYTIEELCFYLCNNLYLLNHSILNKDLCSWIDQELDMPQLSNTLLQTLPGQSLGRFVVTILSEVGFCDDDELEEIQHTLLSLKDQTEEEQSKKKADNLLNNGKYELAVREYERILRTTHSDKLGDDFYGRVHHNKGVAYAKQFLFEEAAIEFQIACELAGKEESMREYLCACYMLLPPDQFSELASSDEKSRVAADEMRAEYMAQERQYHFIQSQRQQGFLSAGSRIDEIKEEYRRSLL